MLYKKYHRNFVRQFKEGTKFRRNIRKPLVDVVKKEPYVSIYYEVRIAGSKDDWILVTLSGQLADSCLNII